MKAAQDAKGDPAAVAILDHIPETTKDHHRNCADAARALRSQRRAAHQQLNFLECDDKPHQDDYAAAIQHLIDQGAPFDGIGLQSHLPARITPIDELTKRLDRYAAFGTELEIAQFRHQHLDVATQADYSRG